MSQPLLHLRDILGAEGTFLLLCTLRTSIEVPLSIFVSEGAIAPVRTVELAHVQHVSHLPAHLEFFKVFLAEWARNLSGQPLVETTAAEEAFAVATRSEVF